MSRNILMIAAIVLVSLTCQLQAAEIYSTWVGGGGGPWGDPSNWNPSVVPNSTVRDTFDVTIDAGGGEVHVGLIENFTINELRCYGNVEIEKETLG